MMRFNLQKTIEIEQGKIVVCYNTLTSQVSVNHDGYTVLRRYLWLPTCKLHFQINGKEHYLAVILFPICKFSLSDQKGILQRDLFPKLKRYSIIMFITGPIRHFFILLAWVVS